MKSRLVFILIALLCSACGEVAGGSGSGSDEIPALVKDYYAWVLANKKETSKFEPKIVAVEGSNKFYLDTTALPAFSSAFMESGYFAQEFQHRLTSYYSRYRQEFEHYSEEEFSNHAKYGRGPLMEVENMDLYFCAQEYEYTPGFVAGIKIEALSVSGNKATAVAVLPYGSKTNFQFQKENNKWLISGYCVFQ